MFTVWKIYLSKYCGDNAVEFHRMSHKGKKKNYKCYNNVTKASLDRLSDVLIKLEPTSEINASRDYLGIGYYFP